MKVDECIFGQFRFSKVRVIRSYTQREESSTRWLASDSVKGG